jgi:hypothetical protein
MSVKWMGVLIIRTDRDPSPIPIPTTYSQVPEGRYKGVAASL